MSASISRARSLLAAALAFTFLAPAAGAAPPVALSHSGGGIAFTFSNGFASDTVAAQTLEAHGIHGTFYVSSGLLRQGPYYTAYMSASDVANLSARGHDIESMGVTARDLTTLDNATLASELSDSQTSLQLLTGKAVRHLAYPYGGVNANVAAAAATRYNSGRTISWTIDDFTPSVDAYHLPGFIMRQSTSLGEAEWIVDQAFARNVYVVLSFGNIITNPGAYDWTPANLDALAAYVQAKSVSAITVSQLVSGAPPPPPPPPPPGSGTIVLTFDDGYTSQLPAAQKLLDSGMRGTFFIVSDCPNGETGGPCMTTNQVKTLSSQGQDVEPHTVTHPDLVTVSARELTHQLRDSQSTLRSWTGTPNVHTAYPYGDHNAVVRAEAAKYYKTARIFLTSPDVANLPTLLAQSGTNPMVVPGVGITRTTSLAKAESYVDYAIAHNTTIVLVFHDFLNTGGDDYTWTIPQFNALVDYVAASHVTVKTTAQAYGGATATTAAAPSTAPTPTPASPPSDQQGQQ